jgi:hypothetical protein
MSRLLAPAALILIVFNAATAGADSIWSHNGSQMRLRAEGEQRTILYESPRPAIARQGVAPGTVLFEGTISGPAGSYSGTAYVFSARCGKQSYAVTGELQDDGRQIFLIGDAPRRDTSTCAVQGTREDKLVFDFVRSEDPPVRLPDLKDGEVCAVEDPDEYKTCLEAQANLICRGRTQLEDQVRCFRESVLMVYKKSQMGGSARSIVDTPFTHCVDGVCSLEGGGPAPYCVRLDAQHVRECDGDVVNERCTDVVCPLRRCRKVCSKAQ